MSLPLVPDDIFDPALYSDVRKPFLEARTLPRWCYQSEAFYRREIERIFLRTWTFVDRVDAIPAEGDYLNVDTFAGPVLILRDHAGHVRAFANTCRHRGARLLEGRGNCRAIVCPYHSWTYDLDGTLLRALGMEKTSNFHQGQLGLKPIRLEIWGGFIFINFNDDSESLLDYLGDLTLRYESYKFEDMVCTRRTEYTVECNWKLLLENAHEDYHTATVHKASLGAQFSKPLPSPNGNWEAIMLPMETSVAVLPGEEAPFPHIAGLSEELAGGTFFTCIFPSTQFACVQDCMWWMRLMPKGPTCCRVQFGFCFPKSTVALADFESSVEPYYRRWDMGIEEDNFTGELQQQGLTSALCEPGPLSWKESKVQAIALWILDRVLD